MGLLSDPASRRAYLLTKAGMLVFAFVLTWPLSHWVGERAWIGFGLFALFLALSTLIMLLLAGQAPTVAAPPAPPRETTIEGPPEVEDRVVAIPVEDSLDLHPFQPAEIPDVVRDYLEAAWGAGFREVRLIHGRGIGVQRERVRSVLSKHPLVREFHDAPPGAGGWGATIARLGEETSGEGPEAPPS